MEKYGYSFVNINYNNPSTFLKQGEELQCTITQQMLLKVGQQKNLVEYTLIALSNDDGESWTLIDTLGKSKDIVLKAFPRLNPKLSIKPKTLQVVD